MVGIGHGPKRLWAKMSRNLEILGAGSLLNKVHIIRMFVISRTSDYCHR